MKNFLIMAISLLLIIGLVKCVMGPTCTEARSSLQSAQKLKQDLYDKGIADQRYLLAEEDIDKARKKVREVCHE